MLSIDIYCVGFYSSFDVLSPLPIVQSNTLIPTYVADYLQYFRCREKEQK